MLYNILFVVYMNPIRLILNRPSISYTAATNAIYISAKTTTTIIITIIIIKKVLTAMLPLNETHNVQTQITKTNKQNIQK